MAVPFLQRSLVGTVGLCSDPGLTRDWGVTVAFTERAGGVSHAPFDTLNLASHVGDDPRSVDQNRDRVFSAIGLDSLRDRLVTAEQVHGDAVVVVDETDAGRGAFASRGRPPVCSCDALVTVTSGLPVMMLFADCVPIVLIATGKKVGLAVVHAGWRGVLAGVVGKAAAVLSETAGARPADLLAYVGPHIRECCYEVGGERTSQFCEAFATITAADGGLDLAAAVSEDLSHAGLTAERIAQTGTCTADNVDRFFSYRVSGVTGRHAALGIIAKGY